MQYEINVPKTYSASASAGLFFLRLIPFVLLFVFHGWAKLVGAYMHQFGGQDWAFISSVQKLGFPYPEYFALGTALAEGVFSLLLVIGLLTRFSAAVIVFNFAVAIYSHVIGGKIFELPALYLAPAIALVFLGAGGFSLDAVINRRFAERRSRRVETRQEYVPASRRVQTTSVPEPKDFPEKSERPL